jgi:ribosomal protein S18 acetylase RimI-like enzyme
MRDITFDSIHMIKELWELNRIYHQETSEHFGALYEGICFDGRMQKFKGLKEDDYKITLYEEGDQVVAYCISTITDGCGEVDSIHVKASMRGNGIGEKLVQKHLEWLIESNCKSIGVTVSQENAATIGFYKKLGFLPNTLYMQQLT